MTGPEFETSVQWLFAYRDCGVNWQVVLPAVLELPNLCALLEETGLIKHWKLPGDTLLNKVWQFVEAPSDT